MHIQRFGFICALLGAVAASSLAQQVYLVDTPFDTSLGLCSGAPDDCGLRGAIDTANDDGADSVIVLADETYLLDFSGADDDNNSSGDLDIEAAVEFFATPGTVPVIEQTTADRVFHLLAGSGTVRFTGPMIIRGGRESQPSGGGGGIFADQSGDLELEDVVLMDNEAILGGGGLRFVATAAASVSLHRVTLTDCHAGLGGGGADLGLSGVQSSITSSLIEGNSAGARAGGLAVTGAGSVVILDTTIRGNMTGLQGGTSGRGGGLAIFNSTAVVRQSAVYDNQAGVPTTTTAEGGGVYLSLATSVLFENSTISGNRTAGINQFGAGIRIDDVASTTLDHTSVVDNSTQGADGLSFLSPVLSDLILKNSIIDGGCSGTTNHIDSQGFNVERPWNGSTNTTCNLTDPSDLKVTDLMLRPLAGYGGPTYTHALLPGSPAQLHVSSAQCQAEDQRHAVRQGLFCDAGAYDDSSEAPGQWIFADGFESGDTAAWSDSQP